MNYARLAIICCILTNVQNISTETLEPTDDIEKNARMKKRIQDQLAKLKRNAERRRQRQLNKNASLAENPVFGLMRGKKEGAIVSIAVFNPVIKIFIF
jgi:hypothetical protein